MTFTKEADFEAALIKLLSEKGWSGEVLRNSTEQDLIDNWANILYDNNMGRDRLNGCRLTSGEMGQIIEQIRALRTPCRLNGFINGGHVTITRDNPEDVDHFGKEVSLKIYDRREIAAGQSRYQIVSQPRFPAKSKILSDRRGDVMLLINGMPVIHIELKKSGVPVSQACYQIEKYAHEGVFTGLFALVQIFVAMNPEETLYFANPGPDGAFNPNYRFHWADFDNVPINDWKRIASDFLSIPMAHTLIGFYTVADGTDGVLKVMRSYQYYAASAISDAVSKSKWDSASQLGGYVWHTTGSGKTMTSFKSAQLIAASRDADKVIFLMDRIELGTQSLKEYRNFAGDAEEVQGTENTRVLITKLKSSDPSDTLIVTSIQKMSNIRDDDDGRLKAADLEAMNSRRIVFIVDECHRSTFGDMLLTIKEAFPRALFFGFTGTPIQKENQKKLSTTTTVFGNELHRYSIADGIRDGNVLGFDPYKVLTFRDADVRKVVALSQADAETVEAAQTDSAKKKIFYKFMNDVPMAGSLDESGNYCRGIEDYLSNDLYNNSEYRNAVVGDILENWTILSRGGKFHAIFATTSIPEAIEYYRTLKERNSGLKVTALFDPNIDNTAGAAVKEDGLKEIIEDYNALYGQDFTIPTFAAMKKDIAARLAHKRPYERVDRSPEKEIDLLIVVDQMLTGFDSKWINTLYLDKMLQYENIIQAFSRTNRLFGPDKPFGTIKYYRRPHTMEKYVEAAIKLYSGDREFGIRVEKLDRHLRKMNALFADIKDLFESAGVKDFTRLPEDVTERRKFAALFKEFCGYLEAARVQGFKWSQACYDFSDEGGNSFTVCAEIDESTYTALLLRYKELFVPGSDPDGDDDDPAIDIDTNLTTIDTGKIDSDYMNSRFDKYFKLFRQGNAGADALRQAEDELHKTFALLPKDEQKYAGIFLRDIQRGDVVPDEGKSFREYITDYLKKAKDEQIHRFAAVFGLDESQLRDMIARRVTELNINEYGRFDALKSTADRAKAKAYFEKLEGTKLIPPKVAAKLNNLLRDFIIRDGVDIQMPDAHD